MNKSIENIWKEGFTNKDLMIPKINDFYNKKSISLVEKIIDGFKKEVALKFPRTFLRVCKRTFIFRTKRTWTPVERLMDPPVDMPWTALST